ncbi:MAG: CaiB/BaiF CoA-transferase family protein [Pseudomonadota bacterium]
MTATPVALSGPPSGSPSGPLSGVRIVDLTRILAGPSATQFLGDLGADIIKIEHPRLGDDTRKWGPPYVRDAAGAETTESSYFLSANRNKRSLAVDIATDEGADIVRRLAMHADVLMENFKVGGLVKYRLDHGELSRIAPHLIYCSITGFGQTGPYASRAGYDFLIQAMGGFMSITGAPEGEPMKGGVAIADLMAGMYAASAVLAALCARDRNAPGDLQARTGQHVDISLLDTQVAWLSNVAMHTLVTGENAPRLGNAHASIVPYRVFASADGHVIVAAGNDRQFAAWCAVAGANDLAADPRYRTNADRVRNRAQLEPYMEAIMATRAASDWIDALETAGVPCGPVNTVDQVFADPHVLARGMRTTAHHNLAAGGEVPQIGNPVKFSATPPSIRRGPPTLGEHTDEVLATELGMDAAAIDDLRARGVIA